MLHLNRYRIFAAVFFTLVTAVIFTLPVLAAHDSNTSDQSCPGTWVPQYGVECASGRYACGTASGIPQCVPSSGVPVCASNAVVNCDQCSCACPSGLAQACAGASESSPSNVSATCQAPSLCSDATRLTANRCTGACGACQEGYIADPANPGGACISPTPAYVNFDNTGELRITGNLKSSGGDLYLNSAQAIRVDGSGATALHIGNWGSAGAGADVNVWGNLKIGDATFPRGLAVSGQLTATEICIGTDCRTSWPTGTVTGTGASGRVAFWTGAATLSQSTNLQWDNLNQRLILGGAASRLGVGTVAPAYQLDVSGDVRWSGTLQGGSVPWARISGIPSACPAGQFVNAIGTGTCVAPAAGSETDPVYLAWYNSVNPEISNLKVTGGGAFGGHTPNGTWRVTTPTLYVGDGANGTIIGAGDSQNAGDIATDGDLTVKGCLGAVFVDTTASTYDGLRGGYAGVRNICTGTGSAGQALAGSHVCSAEEILESIKCGSPSAPISPIYTASGFAWVNNGPPAYLAQANDCQGWINNTDAYGAMWEFGDNGGKGVLTGCNTLRAFACCK